MYHASYIISSFLAACPTFWCFLRCDSDDLPGLRIPQGFPEGGPSLHAVNQAVLIGYCRNIACQKRESFRMVKLCQVGCIGYCLN